MAEKFDIFPLLNQIDLQNFDFIEKLSDEDLRQISLFAVQKFLSGTNNSGQIAILNEVANRYTFPLAKHKKLMLKLMCISGPGEVTRHWWPKSVSIDNKKIELVKRYFGFSTEKAINALKILSNSHINDMAIELGLSDEEIEKILE